MPTKKKTVSTTPIASVKHADKRVNIPTRELRDFVAADEKQPKTVLYPRDPSLDPQLVWRGKDEQDQAPLAVPAVPIYIQEKIHPQAIIENVRAEARKGAPRQASLFADFNDLAFEDLVDFYRHEQNWTNRMILGDSLLAMTSLAEKEGLKGRVQMIYFDPPYGIKFGSNWQVSTRKRDVQDNKATDATRQPEQVKAFRDTWKLGIHSYLSYLRDRLVVTRELLNETGSVFVQIGDENLHLVRAILDEVFGSENFCGTIGFSKTVGATSELLPGTLDFIVWYAKSKEHVKYHQLFHEKDMQADGFGFYAFVEFPDGSRKRLAEAGISDDEPLAKNARFYYVGDLTSARVRESHSGNFSVDFRGQSFLPSKREWSTNQKGMERLLASDRIEMRANSIGIVRYSDDFPAIALTNNWPDTGTGSFTDAKVYVVQTGTKVIQRCVLMTTDPGDLVLDPTCGSGTTAYVAEQWGRRWITLDTSRVAIALARTRLMAARYPYYLLADTPEGRKKEAEFNPPMAQMNADFSSALSASSADIKRGFVYKRVPHVTLKAIANNEEIDALHAQWQAQLEPLRAGLNQLLKQKWEEWEIPRAAEAKWPEQAKAAHAEWQQLRRERQQAIDASIARRAETELLYDQPYEDHKRIRVTGPFTVESLSPHRMLAAEAASSSASAADRFIPMILDNLKAAGVQNTDKRERLKFDRLEPFAGVWLHARGECTEKGGAVRRVAVCVGPEHGTVGPDLVKEAAKEAVLGVGFDVLIICGFAFDPHVSEEARRYGQLTVLIARMNPDLAMGDELLKKTGAGNLFMVFGEPDIAVKKLKSGQITLTLRGVDVYDPTTGQVRSNSTDDIACWFIDADYNGESFFVRQAYFTGAGEPYEKLKRALRAEVDEAAWSALYAAHSLPFDPPANGKIAVKVINHYGDDVLKVYPV